MEKIMSDYYERPVDGKAGVYCSSCQTVKPPEKFKRRLSRAQSAARGYAGNVLLVIDSKLCTSCQPRPKPPKRMSKKELLNKVASGDMNELTAQLELKRRHAEARAAQRRAADAMWDKKRAAPWRFMVGRVSKEIEGVRYQQAYYKKRGTPEVLAFLSSYRTALDKLRAYLRVQATKSSLRHSTPPDTHWWPAMMDKDEREAVSVAWQGIDSKTRILMRQPLFLQWANPPKVDPMLEEDRLYQASQVIQRNARAADLRDRQSKQQTQEVADDTPTTWEDI
jgi:hypothetical protein